MLHRAGQADSLNGGTFTVHVSVWKISEKAGIKSNVVIYSPDGNPFVHFNLDVDDGRWNKFSVLFAENGEKHAKQLSKVIRFIRHAPFMPKGCCLVRSEK